MNVGPVAAVLKGIVCILIGCTVLVMVGILNAWDTVKGKRGRVA